MQKLVKQTAKQLADQMARYGEVLYTAVYKCDKCKEQSSVKRGAQHLCIKHYLEEAK